VENVEKSRENCINFTHLHFTLEFFLYNVNFLSQIYNTFDKALRSVLQICLTRNILLLPKK
jgi:hypothetical protein